MHYLLNPSAAVPCHINHHSKKGKTPVKDNINSLSFTLSTKFSKTVIH
jgi:hypothetical protein